MATERRLIDANALKDVFAERYDEAFIQAHTRSNREFWEGYSAGVNWGRNTLADTATVDAVEVVHGRWMPGYPISCSVCGGAAATDYEDANRYEAWITPYCPNCGAKMDGDGNG